MHFWLAASLDNQGRLDEAIAAATTGMKLAPDQDTRQMFEKMIDNFSKSKPDSKGD